MKAYSKITILLCGIFFLGGGAGVWINSIRYSNQLDKLSHKRGIGQLLESKLDLSKEQEEAVRKIIQDFSPQYYDMLLKHRKQMLEELILLEKKLSPYLNEEQKQNLQSSLYPNQPKNSEVPHKGRTFHSKHFLNRVQVVMQSSPKEWIRLEPILNEHGKSLFDATTFAEFDKDLSVVLEQTKVFLSEARNKDLEKALRGPRSLRNLQKK